MLIWVSVEMEVGNTEDTMRQFPWTLLHNYLLVPKFSILHRFGGFTSARLGTLCHQLWLADPRQTIPLYRKKASALSCLPSPTTHTPPFLFPLRHLSWPLSNPTFHNIPKFFSAILLLKRKEMQRHTPNTRTSKIKKEKKTQQYQFSFWPKICHLNMLNEIFKEYLSCIQ